MIGGTTALLAFLGGVWFPLGDGFMGDVGRALPSYWLVQAGHIGIGGEGWSATGWAVMAAWTVGAHRARGPGLPARHREAVAPSATISACDGSAKSRWRGARRSRRCASGAGVALGVLFLAGPISDLGDESLEPSVQVALGVGVALFIAVYMSVLPPARWLSRRGAAAVIGALALLPAIAIALLAAGAPPSFSALFVYVAAATGMLLPPRIAARADRGGGRWASGSWASRAGTTTARSPRRC